jgi:tetratricopeptide (TPR) repeat protein
VKIKKSFFAFFLFLIIQGSLASQTNDEDLPQDLLWLKNGVSLYGEGKFSQSLSELRKVSSESSYGPRRAEALYWIALAELQTGEYAASLADFENLEKLDPYSQRIPEIPYHKGRDYYYLGRFNEAIVLLTAYAGAVPANPDGSFTAANRAKKASALYWIGECLYSMGQLDKAGEVFANIIENYPESPKYEAASYRLDLIKQKKLEGELLELLKWSHEESLKAMEEYQRREHSYEQALIAYQKRIADMLKDTRLSDLEKENARAKLELSAAEDRIRILEEELKTTRASVLPSGPNDRLWAIKNSASGLEENITKSLAGNSGENK